MNGDSFSSNRAKTIRDEFAEAALKNLITYDFLAVAETNEECDLLIQNAAVLSYKIANAMILARESELPE